MAFIPNFQNGETSEIKKKILKIVQECDVSADRALFLLIEYNWNVKSLRSDNRTYRRFQQYLDHTVNAGVGSSQLVQFQCQLCSNLKACATTDCLHKFCVECLEKMVKNLVKDGKVLMRCPVCTMLLNTSLLQSSIGEDSFHKLTRAFLNHHNNSKETYCSIALKVCLVLAPIIVGGSLIYYFGKQAYHKRLLKWQVENPLLSTVALSGKKLYDKGVDPSTPGYWSQLFVMSKPQLYESSKSLFKQKLGIE